MMGAWEVGAVWAGQPRGPGCPQEECGPYPKEGLWHPLAGLMQENDMVRCVSQKEPGGSLMEQGLDGRAEGCG